MPLKRVHFQRLDHAAELELELRTRKDYDGHRCLVAVAPGGHLYQSAVILASDWHLEFAAMEAEAREYYAEARKRVVERGAQETSAEVSEGR